jgi:hypothetical protein
VKVFNLKKVVGTQKKPFVLSLSKHERLFLRSPSGCAATKSVHPSTSSGRTDFVAAQLPFFRFKTKQTGLIESFSASAEAMRRQGIYFSEALIQRLASRMGE